MRLRNPRYTGANRCWPCTTVNVVLLGAGAAVLGTVSDSVIAIALFTVGSLGIALHGYLIPGTPQLTRVLPDPILTALGKNAIESGKEVNELPPNLPVTEALFAAKLLNEANRLPVDAEETISASTADYIDNSDALKRAIVDTFDGVVEVSVRRSLGGGENWFAFDTNEVTVNQWENRAVAALDTVAIELLAERIPDWDDRPTPDRDAMVILLRYGLQACPVCANEYVESEGARVTCCGGRSLVGERRCSACNYALVDRNDLPTNVEVSA